MLKLQSPSCVTTAGCRYAAALSPAYLRNFNQFCLLSTAGQRGAGRRRAEKSHPLDVTFGGSRGLQLFSKPAPAPLSPCPPARAGSSEAQDINYPFIHYLLLALFSLQRCCRAGVECAALETVTEHRHLHCPR